MRLEFPVSGSKVQAPGKGGGKKLKLETPVTNCFSLFLGPPPKAPGARTLSTEGRTMVHACIVFLYTLV